MPTANFFRSLGLFVAENFLAPEFCSQLRAQMSSGHSKPGIIVKEDHEVLLEENVRKVSSVDVDLSMQEQTRDLLVALMPRLESHFKVSLDHCEGPDFLKYGAGAFYLPHKDGKPGGAAKIDRRRVSAVIFLNAQSNQSAENSYGGGSLTFYGLLDGPEWGNLAFPLEPETGLLIAFRSDVVHEVRPVTFGERFTVVSWFTSNE
jgi:SM-20-related protein